MERQKLSLEESEEINRSLNERLKQLDTAMTDIGKLTSQLTDYPALAGERGNVGARSKANAGI